MARSVMEHVTDPKQVYGEMHRVLRRRRAFRFPHCKPMGLCFDYRQADPQRPPSMDRVEDRGRAEQDVFPIAYRTNTRRAVEKWARHAGFEIISFRYLGQYPSYFMFNGPLFLLATGYEKLIGKVRALNFLRGWIFVTLRKF